MTTRRVADMRSRLLLMSLLAVDLAGLFLLHDLGTQPWTRFDPAAPPEDAVMALLRVVALVAGWWLVATTVLYGLARGVRAGRLASAVGRCMLPTARRLVEASLAATLVVGPAPAAFAERAAPPPVRVETPPTTAGMEILPPVVAPPGDSTPPRPPVASTTPTTSDEQRSAQREHVVRPGEHLWSIAATIAGDTHPEQVARYWRRLVETNRERLRSGDPDLLYPGERLRLPPLTEG